MKRPLRSLPFALALALAVTGCSCERPEEPVGRERTRPAPPALTAEAPLPDGPERIAVPERLVAIGDVHGDVVAARTALRLAGAIDRDGEWIGGKLVVVQTGDQLDRGNDEPDVLALFDALADKAKAKGGRVISLNGNHEIMNVQGDFRYVTGEGFSDFASFGAAAPDPAKLARFPEHVRPRAAAFLPGGHWAQKLAERPVTAIAGDTLFAHGGVLPAHTRYGLAKANQQARSWMRGEVGRIPPILDGDDALVWTRAYADPGERACTALGKVLTGLGVKRLVVGHTVQKDGITSGCNDRVWRIDVGMAKHYGGKPAVLEIQSDRVRTITEPGG